MCVHAHTVWSWCDMGMHVSNARSKSSVGSGIQSCGEQASLRQSLTSEFLCLHLSMSASSSGATAGEGGIWMRLSGNTTHFLQILKLDCCCSKGLSIVFMTSLWQNPLAVPEVREKCHWHHGWHRVHSQAPGMDSPGSRGDMECRVESQNITLGAEETCIPLGRAKLKDLRET